ncbi:MAG: hypothetical protein EOM50_09375 [Erysipelotrichia bacterium]|nr:hypothetical protein [Erysipelotrichia bacterium]
MAKINIYCVLFVWLALSMMLIVEVCYFSYKYTLTPEKMVSKEALSAIVGLPDIALVNEAHYVRHRSLSSVFSYFNESPELLEYFPSTFVYNYAPYMHPSRIEHVF